MYLNFYTGSKPGDKENILSNNLKISGHWPMAKYHNAITWKTHVGQMVLQGMTQSGQKESYVRPSKKYCIVCLIILLAANLLMSELILYTYLVKR